MAIEQPTTTTSYFIESRPAGTDDQWEQTGLRCSWQDPAKAAERLAAKREMRPEREHRLVTRTTVVTEIPTEAASAAPSVPADASCTCAPPGDWREEGPQQPDEDCPDHGNPQILTQPAAGPTVPADTDLLNRLGAVLTERFTEDNPFSRMTDEEETDEGWVTVDVTPDKVVEVLQELLEDEPSTPADAVPAVLPAPADRAAVIREAIEAARRESGRLAAEMSGDAAYGARAVAKVLRRMAVEAQQAGEGR